LAEKHHSYVSLFCRGVQDDKTMNHFLEFLLLKIELEGWLNIKHK